MKPEHVFRVDLNLQHVFSYLVLFFPAGVTDCHCHTQCHLCRDRGFLKGLSDSRFFQPGAGMPNSGVQTTLQMKASAYNKHKILFQGLEQTELETIIALRNTLNINTRQMQIAQLQNGLLCCSMAVLAAREKHTYKMSFNKKCQIA